MLKSNIMEFELTPEIIDEVVFAMEDQSNLSVFDARELRCRPAADAEEVLGEEAGAERFIPVPEWDSVSGFRLMERFVSLLKNPVAREELRDALASGHGVFRSFKNILKTYPELERKWYRDKDAHMRRIVLDWYNDLRDSWGLERITLESEETSDIVESDFSFHPARDEDLAAAEALEEALTREVLESLPGGLFDAVQDIQCRLRGDDGEGEAVLVAESADGELSGMISSCPVPRDNLLAAQISFIGVYPEFRGLGIAKELVSRTADLWASRGFRWLLAALPVLPPEFAASLGRMGFVQRGHLSALDLESRSSH